MQYLLSIIKMWFQKKFGSSNLVYVSYHLQNIKIIVICRHKKYVKLKTQAD